MLTRHTESAENRKARVTQAAAAIYSANKNTVLSSIDPERTEWSVNKAFAIDDLVSKRVDKENS